MAEQIREGRIWFGSDGKGVPRKKTYLAEREGRNLWTWWPNNEVGHTQEATKELTALFGKSAAFDYPKPLRLISRIIQVATKPDSIILDSFAGSGTTAHAVLEANRKDGGNRKFILIEMEDYADSITAGRIKKVIDGYCSGKQQVEGINSDFSFYELGDELLINGLLNENLSVEKIREYIYYSETRNGIEGKEDEPYYMGVSLGNAFYFYYKKEEVTTLNRDFLHQIKTKAQQYTIYADVCTLSDKELEKYKITFKKIPRDIARL